MSIVGGFDLHRSQITFDYLDTETGEVTCGRIAPADRSHLREWLNRFQGKAVAFALEGCTGWRFVVEELRRVGIKPHLAEPADTSTLRGPKMRAKTDRADARLQRELLTTGRLPESWIPQTTCSRPEPRSACMRRCPRSERLGFSVSAPRSSIKECRRN